MERKRTWKISVIWLIVISVLVVLVCYDSIQTDLSSMCFQTPSAIHCDSGYDLDPLQDICMKEILDSAVNQTSIIHFKQQGEKKIRVRSQLLLYYISFLLFVLSFQKKGDTKLLEIICFKHKILMEYIHAQDGKKGEVLS